MYKIIYLFLLFSTVVFGQADKQGSSDQDLLIAIIGVIGIIIGSILTTFSNIVSERFKSKTQIEHYKRTSKDELIDKWILELKTNISKIMSTSDKFRSVILNFKLDIIYEKYENIHLAEVQEYRSECNSILLNGSDLEKKLKSQVKALYDLHMELYLNLKSIAYDLKLVVNANTNKNDLQQEIINWKKENSERDNYYHNNISKPKELESEIVNLLKLIIKKKEEEKSVYR